MTYAVGGLIQASDYNDFVNTGTPNLNNIWATGSFSSGYGQSALPAVTTGDIIAANSWTSLINAIEASAAHQGTAITDITQPSIGSLIQFYSTLQSNLNSVNTNRLNAVSVGTDITDSGARTGNWGGEIGIPALTSTITVTFGNSDQARYFFNAGGTLRIACSRTGAVASPQDTVWTGLCADIGTLVLPAVNTAQIINGTTLTGFTKIGGGGQAPDIYNRQGYYQLNANNQILFRQVSGSGVYTNDNITVTGRVVANTIVFVVQFNEFTSGGTSDLVTGTLTVTATARTPSVVNLSQSWGTPTITVTDPA